MTDEQKAKISNIMKAHLTSKGWPNVPRPHELVMAELRPMFDLLLNAGLVSIHDWENYEIAAAIQYTIWSR